MLINSHYVDIVGTVLFLSTGLKDFNFGNDASLLSYGYWAISVILSIQFIISRVMNGLSNEPYESLNEKPLHFLFRVMLILYHIDQISSSGVEQWKWSLVSGYSRFILDVLHSALLAFQMEKVFIQLSSGKITNALLEGHTPTLEATKHSTQHVQRKILLCDVLRSESTRIADIFRLFNQFNTQKEYNSTLKSKKSTKLYRRKLSNSQWDNYAFDWDKEPESYLIAADRLINASEFFMAIDILNHVINQTAHNTEYLVRITLAKALALTRMKSSKEAIRVLDSLTKEERELANKETLLGLYGRCYKDMAIESHQDKDMKQYLLERSYSYYSQCFKSMGRKSCYSGINAASMALLLGNEPEARKIAKEVSNLCVQETLRLNSMYEAKTLEADPNEAVPSLIDSEDHICAEYYWVNVTMGECCIVLQDWDDAIKHYENAVKRGTPAQVSTSWHQFITLSAWYKEHTRLPEISKSIDRIESLLQLKSTRNALCICNPPLDFRASGAECVDEQWNGVRDQIKQKLEDENVGCGYCCGFPGLDIIFAECLIDRGADVYIVLPIPQDLFRDQCVKLHRFDEATDSLTELQEQYWLNRFDRVLNEATQVIICNDMSKDMTAINFQYGCYMATGLATMKSHFQDGNLYRITLENNTFGLSRTSPWIVKHWENTNIAFDIVRSTADSDSQMEYKATDLQLLDEILSEVSAEITETPEDAPTIVPIKVNGVKTKIETMNKCELEIDTTSVPLRYGPVSPKDPKLVQQHSKLLRRKLSDPTSKTRGRRKSISPLLKSSSGPPQVIKAILFADVAGYSNLKEHEVFFFAREFLGRVARLIDGLESKDKPIVRNTWGDALYFVFDTIEAGGVFALLLRDMVNRTNWAALQLPHSLSIRVSMHAGPVFPLKDAVLNEENFTGVHTSRAARIEPITPPGSVYCSRAFAALSAAQHVQEFRCTYVGNVPLHKKYGTHPIHVVRWSSTTKRNDSKRMEVRDNKVTQFSYDC